MSLSLPEIIRKKKAGSELTRAEVEFFVEGVVRGAVDDCQTGALLMAMSLRKLSPREMLDLTRSFISTGQVLSFEEFSRDVLADKHSTGGVGDKISLVLAPALAACGLKVPMISGRGLGHTGGTLDKLESIPGFRADLDVDRMRGCLADAGCFICGATEALVPADAILYRIRDVTGTADEPGLIVASILSKKASEGIGTLVMDVKYGRGALVPTAEEAQALAALLLEVGEKLGLKIRVVVSEMNVPLGRFVGNALEVLEAVLCLRNEARNHVTELAFLLGGLVLESTGLASSLDEGKKMVEETIASGAALRRFLRMLTCQGVSQDCARRLCEGHYWSVLPKAPRVTLLRSPRGGVVANVDALAVAKACWSLGGGRTGEGSRIDHSAGVVLLKTPGEAVEPGEPWAEVHHSGELPAEVEALLRDGLAVEEGLPRRCPPLTALLFH